jgi:drug/metabolite transporter superfamily protein YnfA
MKMAADPSYPLFPIASILCSFLLLLSLATRFFRQYQNFGVTVLSISLFFTNLVNGVNTIVWADNADLKAFVYCDIGESLILVPRGYNLTS